MALRGSLFALLVVVTCSDSAVDDWKQSLSAQERETLENAIARLQKKSKKEQDIASQDGPEAQAFFETEYERKILNVVKKYQQLAEKSAPASDHSDPRIADSDADARSGSGADSSVDSSDGSSGEARAVDATTAPEPLMLVAESEVDEDEATNGWKASLSAEELESLQNGIYSLHKKSKKEQEIAAQDGSKAQAFFKKEYEGKSADLLKKYKSIAEKRAAAEAKSQSQAAISSARSSADSNSNSGVDSSADLSADLQSTESSAADDGAVSEPLMLLAESSADAGGIGTDARKADKELRRAARKADKEARFAARTADEEARKAARRADEEVRLAARTADEEARKAARSADEKKRDEERKTDEEARKASRKADEQRLQAESTAIDAETTTEGSSVDSSAEPLMLLVESNVDAGEVGTDARKADKEMRRAARKADKEDRLAARTADEETRKAARRADEEARLAARTADEEARKAARLADEKKRDDDERHTNAITNNSSSDDVAPIVLPALEQRAVTFIVSFAAGASLVAIAARASFQIRWCRNHAQVALLDDVAQV